MTKSPPDVKIAVLRKNIDETAAMNMIEEKKTVPFKSLLSRPKKQDVHVHSLEFYYECILAVSGKYVADYFRKANHTISVDSGVHEVSLGGKLFPMRPKSVLKKAFSGKRGKNKIDLKLEEHVFVKEEAELFFDHHGHSTQYSFKLDSNNVESYPKRLLKKNSANVRKSEITHDAAIKKLESELKKPLDEDLRDLNEEFTLNEITEVYAPVFESRLTGPKNKEALVRVDAARKKIL